MLAESQSKHHICYAEPLGPIVKKEEGPIEYYVKGKNPHLFIVAGQHGDESSICPLVRKAMKKYTQFLPDFVYIPEASPSAVQQKTRDNYLGHNVNRYLHPETTRDEEIEAFKKIVSAYQFQWCFSFHEDLEYGDFYILDHKVLTHGELPKGLVRELKPLRIGLLNDRYDDSQDLACRNWVIDGISLVDPRKTGQLLDFGIEQQLFAKMQEIEIPGKIDQEKKEAMIDMIFQYIILPACEY